MFSCFHVLIRIFTVGSIRHIYVIKCSIFWRFYDDNLAGTHSCLSSGVNPRRIQAISKRTASLRHFLSIRTFEHNSLVRNTRQRADSLLANSAESANDDDKFSRMPASQKPTAELPVTLPEPPAMSAGVHSERKCADNHNQSINHHHHHHFICPIIQQYAHLHEYNKSGTARSDMNTNSCPKTFNKNSHWVHILSHK